MPVKAGEQRNKFNFDNSVPLSIDFEILNPRGLEWILEPSVGWFTVCQWLNARAQYPSNELLEGALRLPRGWQTSLRG